ncbi:hypothetical protein, partial [Salsipaludibacter albus]|uniref:hypothetical protein n=1 Tax=Salsipaludibacter albus TaxID=2849650 RepID=UPI001EE45705
MLDAVLVRPTAAQVAATLPGDELVARPDVVMDRAFDLPGPPEAAWPWFNQLGKGRSGWYLPRWWEAVLPRRRRALRHLDPALQDLEVGDVIADWGGRDATFEIWRHEPPHVLVHRSTRGTIGVSWAIVLGAVPGGTRVHLRLRLEGVRRRRLVELAGGLFDLATISGLAAGMRERLAGPGASGA